MRYRNSATIFLILFSLAILARTPGILPTVRHGATSAGPKRILPLSFRYRQQLNRHVSEMGPAHATRLVQEPTALKSHVPACPIASAPVRTPLLHQLMRLQL
jgi:hypothetical protein